MISVLRIMNRTTTVIVALIAAASLSTIVIGPQQHALAWHHGAAAAAAVPKGSWLTAPYGDSPDALFFCGAGLRQFTGIGAYGCGNGPEGGQVYPWALPSAANSRLEFLVIGPSADGAAVASTVAAAASAASGKTYVGKG